VHILHDGMAGTVTSLPSPIPISVYRAPVKMHSVCLRYSYPLTSLHGVKVTI